MVMKSKDSYRLEEQGGFFVVMVRDESHCPVCGTLLLVRATRKRVWWSGNEEKQMLQIRRLYCGECERIHHEIPDCLVPYKRYGTDVIENIISTEAPAKAPPPCPSSTASRIRAWWKALKPYFLHILMTLVERFGVSFGNPPDFREKMRAVANSNNWVFSP